MKKRITSLTLCLILTLALLAGCGGGDTSTPTPAAAPPTSTLPPTSQPTLNMPPQGEKYAEDIVFLGGDKIPVIDTANPAFNVAQSCWITNMVFSNLIKFTVDGEYVPALASSWETDDYKTFVFKLRDDVTFHNGEKFTADDVAFTIDRAKEALGTQAYDRYTRVESYEIINDYEIKIVLAAPNVDFIDDMAWPNACIVNREAIEADPDKGPMIGTGPWMVGEFASNEYVKLLRYDDYWGELPVTKTFTIKFVSEISARLMMLENGECDAAYDLDPMDMPAIEADPNYDCYSFILNNTAYLGFNMNDPLMSDINFRMAVASAISRQDCVDIARNGYALAVDNGTYWGYKTEFKNEALPIIPRDLEKAKEYLAQSSYNGETVEICAAMSAPIKNAQIIQQNLQEIGINCEIYETDAPGMGSYSAWGNSNVQIIVYSGGWSLKAIASKAFLYPGAANNRTNYDNPEVKELFDRAAESLDAAEREECYMRIQEIVAEEIPYLGIFNMRFIIPCQKGVDGIQLFPNSNHDLTYMYKVIE